MPTLLRVNQSRLDLLDALPKNRVIAELGVFKGDFSEEILERCRPRMLYLVDTFRGIVSSGDENGENVCSVDMSKMRWELEIRFSRKPVQIVKSDSIVWLEDQDSEFIDAVYIDTTHTEGRTIAELNRAMRVVKPGGFICGHDYALEFQGVVNAVNWFCNAHGLPLYVYQKDNLPSYRIDKPHLNRSAPSCSIV